MKKDVYGGIYSIVSRPPKIDVHTHVTAGRLMARGLDDVGAIARGIFFDSAVELLSFEAR
jgi:hypothetical protein